LNDYLLTVKNISVEFKMTILAWQKNNYELHQLTSNKNKSG